MWVDGGKGQKKATGSERRREVGKEAGTQES